MELYIINTSICILSILERSNKLHNREQVELSGDTRSTDLSTKKNLEDLVEIGRNLLDDTVSRVNIETGLFEQVTGEGSNRDALTR